MSVGGVLVGQFYFLTGSCARDLSLSTYPNPSAKIDR